MPEPKSTKKLHIVGEQVAAARGLLKMQQAELIEATGVSKATIIRFEAGGSVRPETMEAVRNVLEERGIVFTNGGEPGVKLRRKDADY